LGSALSLGAEIHLSEGAAGARVDRRGELHPTGDMIFRPDIVGHPGPPDPWRDFMSAGNIATRGISRPEFVALIAALMAVDALAIDIMLPALPDMGDTLGVANANDRSLVLTVFLIGFGLPQLIFGPLTDRFGRRAPILIGLTVYAFTALFAPLAPNFALLLLLRFVQGVAAASVRVAMLSAVRDRYSGKAMADIMSLVFAIFLLVPILMPGVGQLILLVASWRLVFVVMGLMAGVVALWTLLRLPESLGVERRRPLDFRSVADGFAIVFANRVAFWYGMSGTFLVGGILGFVNTSQPIYVGIFKLGVFFPLAFAATAVVAAVASSLAPRIIDRLGVHRTAHGAAIISTATCALWLAFSVAGLMPFWLFVAMVAIFVIMLVVSISTTTSLAMQPMGEVAGTASAVFGAMQTVGGAVLGYFVAQAFNGTVVPLVGALFIFDLCILACLLIAEQGRLFAAPKSSPAAV
jgi:MFS transporter, DHA1 family, multidrug resistance protein